MSRELVNKHMVERHNKEVADYRKRQEAESRRRQQEALHTYDQVMNPGLSRNELIQGAQRTELRLAQQDEDTAKKRYEAYRASDQRKTDWDKAIRDAIMEMPTAGSSLDLELGKLPGKTINQNEAQHEAAADYFEQNRKATEDRHMMENDVAEVEAMSAEDRKLLETYAFGRNEWFDHQRIGDSISARAELEKKYGKQKVEELAESWQRYQNMMSAERTRQETQEDAGDGFLAKTAHSGASVVANAVGALSAPLGYLQEAVGRTGRYQTLDPNNAGAMPGKYASAVRETVSEDMGTAGKVLYHGTMGALDNLARIAMGGGTKFGSLGLAALGSFGSTLSEASAQGATPGQAVGKAVLSSGIEVATEYVPLDELFKAGKGGFKGAKAAFKQALKQGGIEAAEEEISLLGNVLVDALVMQEKSAYNQQIGELVANGMSYQDAKNQADRALWDEAVNTALTSFVSGGVMSGAQSGGQYIAQRQQDNARYKADLNRDIQAMMQRESAGNATGGENATVSKMEAVGAENATTEKPTAEEYIDAMAEGLRKQPATQEKPTQVTDEQIREAMNELYPREKTGQERMDELEAEMDRMVNGNELTTEEAQSRYQALSREWNELNSQLEGETAGRADSLESEEAPPDRAMPEYTGRNERISGNPLAGRTEESVGSRSVKAYQYENPEVKPYFRDAARGILTDINNSLPGQKTFDEDLHYRSGGEKGWTGNKRVTTDDLAEIKDTYGYTWDELREAAEDIIHDRGRENNAASKRLEFLIHDRLANGYTDVEGRPMPANQEYLDFLEERQINEYRREGMEDLVANAERYAPPKGAPEGFEAMGAASLGFSPYTQMQIDYGNIPEGENAVRPDDAPISTDGTDRVSYTARTAIGAEVTPDEFVPLIENEVVRGGFSFIPISNDQTVQNAVQGIQAEGWQTARANWTAQVRQGRTGADITATGALLYNHAVNSGNYREAMDILLDYQQAVRNAAQAVQAARILKRLTPENRLYMIRRSVQRMVEDMHLNREITIDADLARQYQETRDDAEADRILDEIARDVARQIPPTLGERITALRYLNMLGNFRTQVRNLAGNLGAKATYLAKDEMAATIEGIASGLSGGRIQRTKVNWVDRTTRNAARADYENVADWISSGGRANDRGTESDDFARRVQENRRILPAGFEQYRRATNWAMNNEYFGDAAFGREAYARALAGYLNARGIRTDNLSAVDRNTLNQAREYAVRQAQEATFRDNNQVSNFVSRALRGRDTPAWARVIGEAIMPFRKTPANVLVRAEEFSPLGLINSAVNTVRAARGDISGSELVESWAKTLTGTGLFAIGWALANMGYLRGGPDEDEGKAAFDELNGYQDYALVLPDGTNLTIDFLSPAAMPMLLGAQLDKILMDKGLTWADLEGVFSTLADPMIEMSMLQGVNDTIDAIRYADNSMGQFLINAMTNYLTQALGNTLLGQVERSTEESRMTTYVDKNSNVPAWLQRNLGKLSQKIPGWDYQQTAYIDQWGEEQKNPEGIKNWLYQLLSPSYIDKGNVDEVAQELYRLNEVQTGTNVFPQSPETQISYTDSDGNRHEKYNLSRSELDKLKRTEGQTQARLVAELIGGKDYSALSDAQKAEAVKLCYDYARELARGQVLPGYDGMDSWMEGIEGKEAGAIVQKVAAAEMTDAFTSVTKAWRDGYSDTEARESLQAAIATFDALPTATQEAIAQDAGGRLGYYLEAKKAGISAGTFTDMYRKYWQIDQGEKNTSQKAQEWAHYLEKTYEAGTITKSQRDTLKDEMVYMQMFPAETEKFDQLTESGLSADDAQDLGWLIQGLQIQEGYSTVRPVQKAEAIAGSKLSEADKIAAMKIYGSDAQDENLDLILEMGGRAEDYVAAWLIYSREDAKGGRGTKARTIQAFMDEMGVDRATATAIYDIYG